MRRQERADGSCNPLPRLLRDAARLAIGSLLLSNAAIADDAAPPSFFSSDKITTFYMEPPSLIYTGENGKMIFTIHPDGKVEIGKDVSMDEVTADFWKAIESFGFKCQANQ